MKLQREIVATLADVRLWIISLSFSILTVLTFVQTLHMIQYCSAETRHTFRGNKMGNFTGNYGESNREKTGNLVETNTD